jgi:putative membrane protein
LLGVPLIVPLGWFGMVLAAHVLAGGRPWLTGLLVVAWDLGLEALMPHKGYWAWQDPDPLWYGAPLQNYLSWFAVGALLSWVYLRLGPELRRGTGLAWAYRLEALFMPVGLALFGLWPAALVCGVAMNALAWWGVGSARVADVSFQRERGELSLGDDIQEVSFRDDSREAGFRDDSREAAP